MTDFIEKTTSEPLISIITVVYNMVDSIEQTILSVLNQTYKNIEYIIIDGGSTDGTSNVIKKYENKLAYWISRPDKGIYDAMNKGKNIATGDFVFFLNSKDTFFRNNVVEKFVSKISDTNYVYYGDAYLTGSNRIYDNKFSSFKLALKNICHQSIFYPEQVYRNFDFDPKYKILSDYHYNLIIFPLYRFHYINEIISYYDTEGISSNKKDTDFYKDHNMLIIKNLGLAELFYKFLMRIVNKIKKICRVNA